MDFYDFLEIMKNIPKPNDIDELVKSNENFVYLDTLASEGYFKLLSSMQKYHLFVTACASESYDIAILLYKNKVNSDALREFMINFLTEQASPTDYMIFRWIVEKKKINFSHDETTKCFFNILKSENVEFVSWFCKSHLMDQINLMDQKIIQYIGTEILENAETNSDYQIGKIICEKYAQIHMTIPTI